MTCIHTAPASCEDCDGTAEDVALYPDRWAYEQACHTGPAALVCAYDMALLELEADGGELAAVSG